jgi:hypothetical protein
MDVKERYNVLLSKLIRTRSDIATFVEMLHNSTSWFSAPASTKYHLNRPQGLLEHSVNVTETLLKLRAVLAPDIPEESCILVGLFHDVGKVGMPGKPYYIENKTKDGKINYKVNPALVTMSIPTRSLYLLATTVKLSEEEVQAILYHDGMYVPEGSSAKHREKPLTLLLHWSDYWESHIMEQMVSENDEHKFEQE